MCAQKARMAHNKTLYVNNTKKMNSTTNHLDKGSLLTFKEQLSNKTTPANKQSNN